MDRQNSLNGLYFNNYRVVHEHIETVSVIELELVVKNRDELLGNDLSARLCAIRVSGTSVHAFK